MEKKIYRFKLKREQGKYYHIKKSNKNFAKLT